MNQIKPVFKKEFLGYFRSPVGYVILAVFHLLVVSLVFYSGYYESNEASLQSLWSLLPWLMLVFIPAMAMRLWSEEKRSGSIELLFTLPMSKTAAVVAKFLAAWAFISLALAMTFSLALTTSYLGSPDWGVMFSGYFGSVLMAAAYLSISCVFSALTKNQVIAFVLSVLVCFLMTALGHNVLIALLEDILPSGLVELFGNLSFIIHFQNMTLGLIELGAVSFFVTLTVAALAINILILTK